ncbi:ImmA/IrrE family metallo-endopeptidase [Robinsoniella sp. KNHs210]|uniref:ImmA/IrrE family metallo-endopeptidase n=1 Tax=Robinsoniella sp. KNHs210 TaxID=1469950 RepID=UPI000487487F|nr:ImmA/IrrE family metallo-endopeptidase [Robinsoniella sp. KNHs210]
MTYEKLLIEADTEELIVKEKPLINCNGLIKGKRIAIRKNIPTIQKSCVLAEELGHYHTTYGNILDQTKTANHKQELKARFWAYNKQIGLMGIIKSFKYGCKNRYEIAKYLDVTEQFLSDALIAYKSKYGIRVIIDNYAIYFEPSLAVFKSI